jgi:hypothetical protein
MQSETVLLHGPKKSTVGGGGGGYPLAKHVPQTISWVHQLWLTLTIGELHASLGFMASMQASCSGHGVISDFRKPPLQTHITFLPSYNTAFLAFRHSIRILFPTTGFIWHEVQSV